jgi:hypothetical protein
MDTFLIPMTRQEDKARLHKERFGALEEANDEEIEVLSQRRDYGPRYRYDYAGV